MKVIKQYFLSFYFVVAPIVSISFIGTFLLKNEALFVTFASNHFFLLGLCSTLLCIFAIIPPTPLATFWGYFWGWWAFLPLIIINLFSILGIYAITHFANAQSLLNFIKSNPKADKLLSKVYTNQFQFVFYTKLSPIFPFALTNYLFAASDIKLRNILLGGLLGMIPRTLLAVWVGREVQEFRKVFDSSSNVGIDQFLIVLLVVVSIAGFFKVFSKK